MKQQNEKKDINKNHSRVSLSGIFNACCGRVVQKQQNVEDPRLQISGMAPLFYNSVKAFTLIELLVVVLIIGILSAIALPQYRVAVAKARFTQAMLLGDAIVRAQKIYYLANNTYAADFDDLDIDMPAGYISKTATRIEYKWGTCNLNYASSGEVECYIYDGSSLTFVAVAATNNRICRDHADGSAVAKQVCLSMGGVENGRFEGKYVNYRLP